MGLCSDWIEAGLNKWQNYVASDETLEVAGNSKMKKITNFFGIYSGWRRLRYFDLEEQPYGEVKIQKLSDQWKVFHDFKPAAGGSFGYHLGLASGGYSVTFSLKRASVSLRSHAYGHPATNILSEGMQQLLEEGKWTRFELSHEFDETARKYILSLFIGGVEVVKTEDKQNLQLQPQDVQIYYGHTFNWFRRLVVLEKS